MLIVGAASHGEVVLDLLRSLPEPPEIRGFIDCGTEGRFVGRKVGGVCVLDGIESISSYAGKVAGVIPAVGDCAEREAIAARVRAAGIPMLAAVHPTSHLCSGVEIGAGSVVLAGALLGVGARIGIAVIVNSGAIIEHHSVIGDFAHIAPGCRLAGGVRAGERVWIGIGATVLQNVCIGPDAQIGAGAVVIRDVEAGVTAVGVPARPIDERDRVHPEIDIV
ncbi:MAG: acetyltransferase [Planctomycetes bacterium]|nr:acetyltransferase [Planctomycetota bacterium]